MDRRTVTGTVAGTLFASGSAAMIGVTALPPHSPYLLVMIAFGAGAMIVGALGFLWLTLRPPALRTSVPDEKQQSTTVKARGGGSVELEDFVSTADTFADVDELSSLLAKRGVHSPR
jgi:hypothetical protein